MTRHILCIGREEKFGDLEGKTYVDERWGEGRLVIETDRDREMERQRETQADDRKRNRQKDRQIKRERERETDG